MPGFRPGKAPRHVIDRFVGRAAVIAEAVDHLVNESYDAALDQVAIIPHRPAGGRHRPRHGGRRERPVRFTATVAVRPEVTLGAYTDYPFSLEPVEVTDEQVEGVITELRQEQATLRPDRRPRARPRGTWRR